MSAKSLTDQPDICPKKSIAVGTGGGVCSEMADQADLCPKMSVAVGTGEWSVFGDG